MKLFRMQTKLEVYFAAETEHEAMVASYRLFNSELESAEITCEEVDPEELNNLGPDIAVEVAPTWKRRSELFPKTNK